MADQATAATVGSEAEQTAAAAAAAAGVCKNCAEGYSWAGQPKGTEGTLGKLKAYIAKPETEGPPGAAILFVHDAFGWSLSNSRLLCDMFCELTGLPVYMPDFFDGEKLLEEDQINPLMIEKPPSILGRLSQGFKFAAVLPRFMSFIMRHNVKKSEPLIKDAVSELKQSCGVTSLGVVGYCWGGKYALRLGSEDAVKAIVAVHPSLVDPKDDLVGLKASVLLLLAEKDPVISKSLREKIEAAIQAAGVATESVLYEGTSHGFATRCDESDENVCKQKDAAARKTAEWFNTQLKVST